MSRLARQTEAYRQARRIVAACNRMKAGQGPALRWCTQQRNVLQWMAQTVRAGLRKRATYVGVDLAEPGSDRTVTVSINGMPLPRWKVADQCIRELNQRINR